MDLSKAFDTLSHSILLCKLQYYGIRGIPHMWFKSDLTDKKQYTVYNSHTSDLYPISCGVPQGSKYSIQYTIHTLLIYILYHVVYRRGLF